MSNKTMKEKRLVDSHLENFSFETMEMSEWIDWIHVLKTLLIKYQMVRGR